MRYLPLLCLLPLLVASDAAAQGVVQRVDGAELHEIKTGAQWKVFSIAPHKSADAQTFAVFPASAVDELEAAGVLPAAEAQEIRDELATEDLDYRQVADTFVVHLEAAAAEVLPEKRAVAEKGCFSWDDPETWSDSWGLDEAGTLELISIEGESYSGDLTVTFPFTAQISSSVTYKVKKKICVPYKFRLLEATATGEVTLDGSVGVLAELNFVAEWHWKKNLLTLDLAEFVVWLGVVPVYLRFELPLDIGIDAVVKATGRAEWRADFNATATFDVVCTSSSDCVGDSNFTDNFDVVGPDYEFTLDANARVWARAAVDLIVYGRDVGVVSVGATGFLQAHLFGYLGNRCGDRDGDGSGDTLEDLLLDIDAGYKIDARMDGLLLPDREWLLLEDLWHLYFWDLWDDPEGWNLLEPLVTGPTNVETDQVATYEFTTRPCYPYSDDLSLEWTGPITGYGTLTPRTGVLTVSEMLPAGDHTLVVTAVDDVHGRDFGVSTDLGVTVTGEEVLPNGVPETDLPGDAGSETFYKVEVPVGATDLHVSLSGGTGDADLYVRFGDRPSTSVHDCGSANGGNDESCSFPNPQDGWYHILVHGAGAYSGVSLAATYTDPPSQELTVDVPISGLAGAASSHAYYTLEVPAWAADLTFNLSGGTGDADLYVRFDAWPIRSLSSHDCQSLEIDNDEICSFPNPRIGTYHVLVHGFGDYSGAELVASYTLPPGGGELSCGTPKTDLAGADGSRIFYALDVSPGTTDLRFELSGGTGDADLYVLLGAQPSRLLNDCGSWETGNEETCTIPDPRPGRYHVMVYGYAAYSGVSLVASCTDAGVLSNGVAECGLAGDTLSETFFLFEVPAAATDLSFTTSGGSGDADLFVRLDAQPTRLVNDCDSQNPDNDESCSLLAPQPGRYHVLVYGFSGYSGVCLAASYNEPGVAGELTNGTPVELAGATLSETFYTFDVPAGVTDLSFNLVGGSGDADLYVRFGVQPSTSDYDCRSWVEGTADSCSFPEPRAGTYHVLVHGYSAYAEASLVASYPRGGGELTNGAPESDLEGATDSQTFYTIDVPAGAVGLTFELSGGTGDADLYVRFGAQPSETAYDCQSGGTDNNDSCSFSEPQAGTYHVLVYADVNYTGASLVASFDEMIFSDGFESGDTTAWSGGEP